MADASRICAGLVRGLVAIGVAVLLLVGTLSVLTVRDQIATLLGG